MQTENRFEYVPTAIVPPILAGAPDDVRDVITLPAPENLLLTLLKAIRTDISTIRSDLAKVKERLCLLEAGYSSLSRRIDRLGREIETLK